MSLLENQALHMIDFVVRERRICEIDLSIAQLPNP